MGIPSIDRGADLIAARRGQPHLAALEDLERVFAERAIDLGEGLDVPTVGAAWMILGDTLAEYAEQHPDTLALPVLVNLVQLAGQRLYTGTGLPREVPCPVVRSNGTSCWFTAKAVTQDLIDAQMRGHYATYHEALTWPPQTSHDVLSDGA